MPSHLHESHLLLLHNQPQLAADLIRDALGARLPAFQEARVASANLNDIQPAEYRADLVVELWKDGVPVYGLVVEVQLAVDDRKRFVWPAYVTNLRARLECPVSLLVITANKSVARWAARSVELGGLHRFTPYVLGPSDVPEVTDMAQARDNPELAVLSAMAHGRDPSSEQAARIALAAHAASVGLDADRSTLYLDLIVNSLGEAALEALKNMDSRASEFMKSFVRRYGYQSDFARQYVAQGRVEGRAALILRLLHVRFGSIGLEMQSRIEQLSAYELDAVGERLLTAQTLEEALREPIPE